MNAQTFSSDYLFRRAEHLMRRKGYVVQRKSEYCGVIEVVWRKI